MDVPIRYRVLNGEDLPMRMVLLPLFDHNIYKKNLRDCLELMKEILKLLQLEKHTPIHI